VNENVCFSDAGTSSTAVSSEANSPQVERHVIQPIQETVSSPQYQVFGDTPIQETVPSPQYQVIGDTAHTGDCIQSTVSGNLVIQPTQETVSSSKYQVIQ
jgi:hypothetical protein